MQISCTSFVSSRRKVEASNPIEYWLHVPFEDGLCEVFFVAQAHCVNELIGVHEDRERDWGRVRVSAYSMYVCAKEKSYMHALPIDWFTYGLHSGNNRIISLYSLELDKYIRLFLFSLSRFPPFRGYLLRESSEVRASLDVLRGVIDWRWTIHRHRFN